ncbi:AAA family ATPase [Herpetosiphon gulosus]|uniref:DNA replication and repair protein RecF n=1 Tax=Herpetosiphon gulosus TaxID=1973496 RepID=A0ABP9X2V4_9CHLR
MSNELQLKSLIIQNFRGFENFQINQLGRVNLIVGKNNVGKTSLLEAILLYANRGSGVTIYDILKDRDEHRLLGSMQDDESSYEEFFALKNLFFGREDFTDSTKTIVIGEDTQKNLSLKAQWYQRQINDDDIPISTPIKFEDISSSENPFPGINLRINNGKGMIYSRIDRYNRRISRIINDSLEINCNIIYSNKIDPQQLGKWRDISLIDGLESNVIEALKIIEPDVNSINMVNYRNNDKNTRQPSSYPIPIVKLNRYDKFIPLKSLGDGINRIFALILALVNSKNGVFIIDEIENGLHYSIYPDVWKLIFKLAETLNVQVFATTHNKECLNAFNKTNKNQTAQSGRLIRLGRKKGKIVATEYNQKDMQVILERDIEVR